MADYPINKGIGHSVEFKGLKAQYLFIFAGGLLAVFFLVVVLYMAGADQLVCIGLGLTLGSLLVWGTFHLNNKYGEHGLMKLLAFPHWGLRFKSLEKKWVYPKESLSYGMLVYKFNHQLLAVLVHLAHTAVKWNTNFLILDVGDKLVNTDDTALMKYEKKFMLRKE